MDNTKSAWDPLVELEGFEVDLGPAPGDYAVAGTLTGATSGVTATVVSQISSTVYVIKDRDGEFTDGEIISDGTNSLDCAAGYPIVTPQNLLGLLALDAELKIADRNSLAGIRAKAKTTQLLGSGDLKILGDSLEWMGKRHTRQI